MTIHTYFDGEKLSLEKEADSFIARADSAQLEQIGLEVEEQTSSASWRIRSNEISLIQDMDLVRGQQIVAHHAYRIKDSREPFLISDRIVVTFRELPTEGQVSHLINEYALALVDTLSDQEYVFWLTDATGMVTAHALLATA